MIVLLKEIAIARYIATIFGKPNKNLPIKYPISDVKTT